MDERGKAWAGVVGVALVALSFLLPECGETYEKCLEEDKVHQSICVERHCRIDNKNRLDCD